MKFRPKKKKSFDTTLKTRSGDIIVVREHTREQRKGKVSRVRRHLKRKKKPVDTWIDKSDREALKMDRNLLRQTAKMEGREVEFREAEKRLEEIRQQREAEGMDSDD
ncbi:unnamed protein product [marine sediment metagenome]|uniref:Uncharacterized protein n=1 Tax=marine sediment metagenome TaxID=412755 RepID=X0YE50_9ZZZZ